MTVSEHIRTIVVAVSTTLAMGFGVPLQPRYVRAEQNENQDLVITPSEGKQIVVAKSDREYAHAKQVGFDDIVLSRDGDAVGWVDLYPNCCTSYPVPILLEVYKDGKRHTFTPAIVPAHWCFVAESENIAAIATTLHGPDNQIIELWNVSTGTKRDKFTWLDGESHPRAPAWVASIRNTQATGTHDCSTK